MAIVTVREAAEADVPRVLELYGQLSLGPDDYDRGPDPSGSRETFSAMQRQPGFHLLVAEEDGAVQGTVVLAVMPNFSYRNRPWAVIENLVVDATQRGRGIGAVLMTRAAEIAREAGCYKVLLASNKQRPEAHHFYRRLGYTQTHEAFHLRLDS
jgi:ribosomal protein S18 acetylase RimI-like enzyme